MKKIRTQFRIRIISFTLNNNTLDLNRYFYNNTLNVIKDVVYWLINLVVYWLIVV